MDVESRLKTALDESRLLILGAQVLFGFQFEAVFQERFPQISVESQLIHNVGLVLLLISVSLLIAPSLFHQIIFRGESKVAAIDVATLLAGASLLPLTVGLGISAFVAFDHLFGRTIGVTIGTVLTVIGLALLYGLGFALRRNGKTPMQETSKATPLKTKIEQMLTEARVIIPGGQALLGFQLIATLTKAFNELPALFKYIHCAGLCAVALAVVLLMTPAAVHRLGFQGEDDSEFFKIGSRLVIAATIPLAIGISSDVAVVFFKTTGSTSVALSAGAIALVALLGFWLAYPIWHRMRSAQQIA
ncbi:DUF6328 family protein [Bradyrhizobium sp. BWA-3-5]|uniref:DUF6328 family protein n=1 Tax=Bradyrhizobium sp. BWA-3-5 TaxID=3080013 RepID=UPI00293F47F1|nr:DUF6328 family protein [Bradyrhizobium sp. BWA-3-5]WOH69099.1 DUF6328 family protein [Bradyrhizobium sp. BWA-3-5]